MEEFVILGCAIRSQSVRTTSGGQEQLGRLYWVPRASEGHGTVQSRHLAEETVGYILDYNRKQLKH